VKTGWNVVVGADYEKIVEAAISFKAPVQRPELYGDGRAAEKIVQYLTAYELNTLRAI
jgi:UDP-N-acetylglucosamine 2-epimerase